MSEKEYESLHRFAVSERNLFRDVPMIPGARVMLRKLSDEGYRIRIITHRLFVYYFHAMATKTNNRMALTIMASLTPTFAL